MSYYNTKTRPKINITQYVPYMLFLAVVLCFGWVVKGSIEHNKKRTTCQTINSMFNRTNVKFNETTEECTGYIRGDLHMFELTDNNTVSIKRKVIKVNYDYGQ